jgi:hypothetical protein
MKKGNKRMNITIPERIQYIKHEKVHLLLLHFTAYGSCEG